MAPNDGRALSAHDIERIQKDVYAGIYNIDDVAALFNTIRVLRLAASTMMKKFKAEPLRRVATAEPLRNSELCYWRELSSIEEDE